MSEIVRQGYLEAVAYVDKEEMEGETRENAIEDFFAGYLTGAHRTITAAELEKMNGYIGTTMPSLKAALRSIGHKIEGDAE